MLRRIFCLLALATCSPVLLAAPPRAMDELKMPAGFSISIFAEGVDGARSMSRSEAGVIYVGSRPVGKVYAVIDDDGDGEADRVITIAEGLNMPNGVAWRDGSLYVAEIDKIWRFDDIDHKLDDPPKPVLVLDDLPDDRHHGWKFIRFSPQGRLFVPVGAPCNICDVSDPYATIASVERMGPISSCSREAFATPSASTGIRRPANSGSPTTDETCWATIYRPMSSTERPLPDFISVTPSVTERRSPTPRREPPTGAPSRQPRCNC